MKYKEPTFSENRGIEGLEKLIQQLQEENDRLHVLLMPDEDGELQKVEVPPSENAAAVRQLQVLLLRMKMVRN